MPRGTHHQIAGQLHNAPRGLELHVNGGGIWLLDVPCFTPTSRLLGKQVMAEGVRAGFDLLEVKRIRLQDQHVATTSG